MSTQKKREKEKERENENQNERTRERERERAGRERERAGGEGKSRERVRAERQRETERERERERERWGKNPGCSCIHDDLLHVHTHMEPSAHTSPKHSLANTHTHLGALGRLNLVEDGDVLRGMVLVELVHLSRWRRPLPGQLCWERQQEHPVSERRWLLGGGREKGQQTTGTSAKP